MTLCVLDAAPSTQGFHCSNGKQEFFLDLVEGQDLGCISRTDAEAFFKACQVGTIIESTECFYQDKGEFECRDVLGKTFNYPLSKMDNWVCVTPQHKQRIIERCKARG